MSMVGCRSRDCEPDNLFNHRGHRGKYKEENINTKTRSTCQDHEENHDTVFFVPFVIVVPCVFVFVYVFLFVFPL